MAEAGAGGGPRGQRSRSNWSQAGPLASPRLSDPYSLEGTDPQRELESPRFQWSPRIHSAAFFLFKLPAAVGKIPGQEETDDFFRKERENPGNFNPSGGDPPFLLPPPPNLIKKNPYHSIVLVWCALCGNKLPFKQQTEFFCIQKGACNG